MARLICPKSKALNPVLKSWRMIVSIMSIRLVSGLSFEIPADDENADSIIKKHPPKRFQKLEDQQTYPTLSLEKLQEKLDEAEIRRQQILQQRIQSAKHRNVLRKQASVMSADNENGTNYLKVPEDVPPAVINPYDVSYV
ncbi:hypothetical protein AMK59_6139 [Oryctes borbonicus]|uniref:Uncharacterized protein n=1 Tax=Oryctes borbonicus TaxID=1629725 RepID=A0A0T6B2K9_9SCAR|nr:hypothetical protein AMK59_6139 [Oryctes borbonicus]